MLPLAVGAIFLPARRNCSLFVGWCDQREMRLRLHLSTPSVHDCSHKVPKASSQPRSDQAGMGVFAEFKRTSSNAGGTFVNDCMSHFVDYRCYEFRRRPSPC